MSHLPCGCVVDKSLKAGKLYFYECMYVHGLIIPYSTNSLEVTGEKPLIRLVQTLTGLCQHIVVDETTCPCPNGREEGVPLEALMTVGDLKEVVVKVVPEVCVYVCMYVCMHVKVRFFI